MSATVTPFRRPKRRTRPATPRREQCWRCKGRRYREIVYRPPGWFRTSVTTVICDCMKQQERR